MRQEKIHLPRPDRREVEAERDIAQQREQLVAIQVEVNPIGIGGFGRAASFRWVVVAVLGSPLVLVQQQRCTTRIGGRSASYPPNDEAIKFENLPTLLDGALRSFVEFGQVGSGARHG